MRGEHACRPGRAVARLEAPITYRTSIVRALTARPSRVDLATLIAMADTDEVVRLRLLRAIRDLGV